jgi:hypothetical protein
MEGKGLQPRVAPSSGDWEAHLPLDRLSWDGGIYRVEPEGVHALISELLDEFSHSVGAKLLVRTTLSDNMGRMLIIAKKEYDWVHSKSLYRAIHDLTLYEIDSEFSMDIARAKRGKNASLADILEADREYIKQRFVSYCRNRFLDSDNQFFDDPKAGTDYYYGNMGDRRILTAEAFARQRGITVSQLHEAVIFWREANAEIASRSTTAAPRLDDAATVRALAGLEHLRKEFASASDKPEAERARIGRQLVRAFERLQGRVEIDTPSEVTEARRVVNHHNYLNRAPKTPTHKLQPRNRIDIKI